MILHFCPIPAGSVLPRSERIRKTSQESAGRTKPAGTMQKIHQGSLTVECAMVLPVFLFACVILISVMNAVRLQTESDLKAAGKARTLAMAAAVSGDAPASSADPVSWVDLCAPHRVNWPVSFPGLPSLVYYSSAYVAKWTGGGISAVDDETALKEDRTVFISDNRAVYHTRPDCTYLNLSIYACTTSDIRHLRNTSGGKYYPCRGFPKGYKGTVYATSNGTYYYPSLNYGALKRHVHTAKLSDCTDLTECSRCRGRG